jgi:hypothetical protein
MRRVLQRRAGERQRQAKEGALQPTPISELADKPSYSIIIPEDVGSRERCNRG